MGRYGRSSTINPSLTALRHHVCMTNRIERRRHVRNPARVQGTGVGEDGLSRHPVTILNVSEAGAMAELAADVPAEGHSVLLFGHRLEPCRLVWRDGRLAGFEFLQVP